MCRGLSQNLHGQGGGGRGHMQNVALDSSDPQFCGIFLGCLLMSKLQQLITL